MFSSANPFQQILSLKLNTSNQLVNIEPGSLISSLQDIVNITRM